MMGVVDNAGDGASCSVSCKSEFHSSPNVPFQIAHSLPILSLMLLTPGWWWSIIWCSTASCRVSLTVWSLFQSHLAVAQNTTCLADTGDLKVGQTESEEYKALKVHQLERVSKLWNIKQCPARDERWQILIKMLLLSEFYSVGRWLPCSQCEDDWGRLFCLYKHLFCWHLFLNIKTQISVQQE